MNLIILFFKLCRRAVVMTYALVLCILPRVLADDHYAAQNGQSPAGAFTTWGSAASNIQDAVNAATTNDTVWVGAGRYVAGAVPLDWFGPSVVVIDKALTLRSSNGVPATAIIDGGGVNRGVAIKNTSNNTNLFIVDGFTISNGYATNFGGGIFVSYVAAGSVATTAIVQNCTISDNTASNMGGGLYVYNATCNLTISNCVIRNNLATNNAATRPNNLGGGGLYAYCPTLITGSAIHGNRWGAVTTDSNSGGGGMYLYQNIYTIRNTLMYANSTSSDSGGAIYMFVNPSPASVTLNMINCTIVGNLAGYGVHTRRGNCTVNVLNSIIYSNAPVNFSPNNSSMGPNTAVTNLYMTYSCTPTNGLSGVLDASNITNSPDFVDWTGNNFRLNRNSPCVNRGLNQTWMDGAKDLDGSPRVDRFSGRVDMGCYEYLPRGMMFKAR